jgi:hypothetical protein
VSTSTKHLANQVRNLTKAIADLNAAVEVPVFVMRNDRDAARFCGFKSVWRFSLWATKRGLKPKMKTNAHERTVYLVSDLRKACEADRADQFNR